MTVTAVTLTHRPGETAQHDRRGRAEIGLAVALSIGAAAIHLAAGPAHVEVLGDLGLGFYWAALLQGTFAVALLGRSGSRKLAWTGIALNVVLVAAWAWSRLIGLPDVPDGPGAVGIADGTAVILQLALVALLAARFRGVRTPRRFGRPAAPSRWAATAGFATLIGVVLVSSTFAVADAATGHGHDEAGAAGHHEGSSDTDGRRRSIGDLTE